MSTLTGKLHNIEYTMVGTISHYTENQYKIDWMNGEVQAFGSLEALISSVTKADLTIEWSTEPLIPKPPITLPEPEPVQTQPQLLNLLVAKLLSNEVVLVAERGPDNKIAGYRVTF